MRARATVRPMKTCFKCNVAKPLDQFYRHPQMGDGHLGKCKECAKADVRENYAKTRPAKTKYEKERAQRPERKAAAIRSQRRYRAIHPERHAAHAAVAKAVRRGDLARSPCEVCGEVRAQAHHDDYSKPLDVRWLCFRCHREHAHGQVVTSDHKGPAKKKGHS